MSIEQTERNRKSILHCVCSADIISIGRKPDDNNQQRNEFSGPMNAFNQKATFLKPNFKEIITYLFDGNESVASLAVDEKGKP